MRAVTDDPVRSHHFSECRKSWTAAGRDDLLAIMNREFHDLILRERASEEDTDATAALTETEMAGA